MGVPHMVIVPRLVSESMRCSTLVMPRSAILCGEERRFRPCLLQRHIEHNAGARGRGACAWRGEPGCRVRVAVNGEGWLGLGMGRRLGREGRPQCI